MAHIETTHHIVEGSGPNLTLLHGVGSELGSWNAITEQLAQHFTVLRYDLRGHGQSHKPPGPYAMQHYVDELCALLDRYDMGSTHLAGFSFGGMIAQAFAIQHPSRVVRLMLVSAVAGRTPEEREHILERCRQLEEGGSQRTIGAAVDRWFTPEFQAAHPEIIEERIKWARENDPAGYAAAYRVFAESDLADELGEISAPTLIMTGEHDIGSNPRMARLMHERIAGSQLHILPNLRHSVLLEAPELIASLMYEFIS